MVFVATLCLTGLCIKLIRSVLQSVQGEDTARNFDGFCSHTLSHALYIKLIHSVLQSVRGENMARNFDGFVATLCLTGCVLS